MFLRRIERRKNGKTHLYWSLVENKRLDGGRVVQRHVLYLGEINSSQAEVWRKAIEVFDADAGSSRTLALFPEDRCEVAADDASVVRLRISEMRLHRPRQWGACWLAGLLWRDLQLDRFWAERLPASRKRTRWDDVLQVLVAYRLIEPGSEWRLHRQWFGGSAMADLLGSDFGLAETHKLYACHGLLLAHKDALFSHLTERWRDLFNANFDVLGEGISYVHGKDVVWNEMIPGLNWAMNGTGAMDYEVFLTHLSRMKRPRNMLVEFLSTPEEYQEAQRNIRAIAKKVGVTIYGKQPAATA